MISISTITANTAGNVIIKELPDSNLTDQSARVSRVKTLDGGVSITHSGVVVGDRTLDIRCRPTEADFLKLKTIFEDEALVLVAFAGEVYTGVITDIRQKGAVRVTIFLSEQVS